MDEDTAIRELRDRTELQVSPEPVRAAIRSQPGDVDAAVRQVVDWWASGQARSPRAGVLLLAALRSQARSSRTARPRPSSVALPPRRPPTSEETSRWERVRDAVRGQVSEVVWHLWLEPLELVAVDGTAVVVQAPPHRTSMVRDRYVPLVLDGAVRDVFGATAELDVVEAAQA